jgi:hypothetical protein
MGRFGDGHVGLVKCFGTRRVAGQPTEVVLVDWLSCRFLSVTLSQLTPTSFLTRRCPFQFTTVTRRLTNLPNERQPDILPPCTRPPTDTTLTQSSKSCDIKSPTRPPVVGHLYWRAGVDGRSLGHSIVAEETRLDLTRERSRYRFPLFPFPLVASSSQPSPPITIRMNSPSTLVRIALKDPFTHSFIRSFIPTSHSNFNSPRLHRWIDMYRYLSIYYSTMPTLHS